MACHAPSKTHQMTAALASPFLLVQCPNYSSPHLKSALCAAILPPQHPKQLEPRTGAAVLLYAITFRSWRRSHTTHAARHKYSTKSNHVLIANVEIIDDFCPAIFSGYWSPKNVKPNTLEGLQRFEKHHTHHEPSQNTDPCRNPTSARLH
jgi:hypothetical protein